MTKLMLAMIGVAVLLAGCGGGLRGDASAGPNPGGGFYGAPSLRQWQIASSAYRNGGWKRP